MTDVQQTRARRAFNKRLKEARIGDAVAQYEVGVMYANGVGVRRSVEQALTWTKAAAEKNHSGAQYLLALAYGSGEGAERDEHSALSWLLRAANAGHDKAAVKLGRFFETPHPDLARRWFSQAAEQGAPDAQLALARHCQQRRDDPSSLAQALHWYQLAAAQHNAGALFAMGRTHQLGLGVPIDRQVAADFFRAAAGLGHAGAQLELVALNGWRSSMGEDSASSEAGPELGERPDDDERWTRYAERGEAADQYSLGRLYEMGYGVRPDRRRAAFWFERAASQGYRDAQAALAQLLEPEEPAQAASWYREAAEHGHVDAQFCLGRLFNAGVGVARDDIQALMWLGRAASQGHGLAALSLAELLTHHASALSQAAVSLAAAQGIAQAEFREGQRHAQRAGPARRADLAAEWYARAADQGHADAQCALAGLLLAGKEGGLDAAQAERLYRLAAEQGQLEAQWQLARLLSTGAGGVKRDARQASTWFRRAADAGFAPAQATLGTVLAQGKKFARAADWWTKAAEQNDPEAMFNLANAYRLGRGVAKSPERAFELLVRAATQGLAPAQARLGLLYATGQGVAQDSVEACKWFVLGAEGGDEAAAANRERARTLLSAAQLQEAERRAADWLRAHESKS